MRVCKRCGTKIEALQENRKIPCSVLKSINAVSARPLLKGAAKTFLT